MRRRVWVEIHVEAEKFSIFSKEMDSIIHLIEITHHNLQCQFPRT